MRSLCADKFVWYETPFSEPITHRVDLEKEWQSILNQDNIVVSYKILSVDNGLGIAEWKASFRSSVKNVVMSGIFKIKLDKQGKCTYFKQWFNYEK